jgi:hypothetical protein
MSGDDQSDNSGPMFYVERFVKGFENLAKAAYADISSAAAKVQTFAAEKPVEHVDRGDLGGLRPSNTPGFDYQGGPETSTRQFSPSELLDHARDVAAPGRAVIDGPAESVDRQELGRLSPPERSGPKV